MMAAAKMAAAQGRESVDICKLRLAVPGAYQALSVWYGGVFVACVDRYVHVLGAGPLQSGSPRAIGWFCATVFSIALCDAWWTLFEGLFVVLSTAEQMQACWLS
mgnify:CR=1